MKALVVSLLVSVLLAVGLVGAAVWYMLVVPGRSFAGPLPQSTAEERDLARRLQQHVVAVASVPHNAMYPEALEKAARYTETTLAALGYQVARQEFTESLRGRTVRNVEAAIEPVSSGPQSATLVVGAHYDSAGAAPGANDNGTGTAAVLELARLLADLRPAHTRVRFVLFVNEEPPYSRGPDMGSVRYAAALRARGENVAGMISLETLGAFSDAPGSQHYPSPFQYLYPSTANFIAFVGLPGSRTFLHSVLASFRRHTRFPTIGGIVPDIVPGAGWSDHWAFAEHGYPGVMITDTALFRYEHYHRPTDTPDKVDYDKLARITKGVERVLRELVR
ncbi:MAG: M28 family peptidase [Hyphomicrobiaceae bacterium]